MLPHSVAMYELEGHTHRGMFIGIARHDTCAPFACNSPLKLHVESNPMKRGTEVVTERCQCGRVVNVWGVLPEPQLVNNDADDDCA